MHSYAEVFRLGNEKKKKKDRNIGQSLTSGNASSDITVLLDYFLNLKAMPVATRAAVSFLRRKLHVSSERDLERKAAFLASMARGARASSLRRLREKNKKRRSRDKVHGNIATPDGFRLGVALANS